MSIGCERKVKTLLKGRPTPRQIDDRLADPCPDGLEFYLDLQDIGDDASLARSIEEVKKRKTPEGFVYVVEGPLRSVDDSFFDLSLDTPGNRDTVRRTIEFGSAVHAQAAVIHAIAPATGADHFDDALREATLDRSLPLLTYYRDLCQQHHIVPTIENIPPVAKMREGRAMHSIIGIEPADMQFLVEQVPGVNVTVDVSHAQLYLYAVNATIEHESGEWKNMLHYIQSRAKVRNLDEYLDALDYCIVEAHISNATGLLGEGMPYDEGDLDMDHVIGRLGQMAQYIVTETIEPDADKAVHMREAQQRINAILRREAL